MRLRLPLSFALCLSATVVACEGDSDSGEPDDASSTEPSDTDPTDTDTDTDTEPSDTDTDTEPSDTDTEPSDTDTEPTDVEGGAPEFSITSPNFDDGARLPDAYTCEGKEFGAGHSPALSWVGAPESAKSYALVFKDLTLLPDLPQYAYHWAAWNIPTSVTGIPEALSIGEYPAELEGGMQYRAGPPADPSFFGPCPSWLVACGGERSTDSYSFTLYAFEDDVLALPEVEPGDLYLSELDAFFASVAVAVTELTATSDAAPSSIPFECPPPPDTGDGGIDAGPDGGPTPEAGPPPSDSDASTDAGAPDAG